MYTVNSLYQHTCSHVCIFFTYTQYIYFSIFVIIFYSFSKLCGCLDWPWLDHEEPKLCWEQRFSTTVAENGWESGAQDMVQLNRVTGIPKIKVSGYAVYILAGTST